MAWASWRGLALLAALLCTHAALARRPDVFSSSRGGLRLLEATEVAINSPADNTTRDGIVQQRGFVLPISGRRGAVVHGRKLLRAASIEVDGSVREVGYFYATVGLGSPSRTFQLIIDTGSTITYVPCADCKHCGKHQDAPFDPSKSKTATMLACGAPKCNCGSPSCQCMDGKCYYSRTYAERSSSDGFLLEDVLAFSDVPGSLPSGNSSSTPPDVRVVFGCENNESGEIYRQSADGIMGLGNNNNALQSQLVAQKVIEDTFSLCFGYPNGGILLLGDVSLKRASEMVYTPMKPSWVSHYYTTTISHVSVAGSKLEVPASVYAQGYGSVLDSGTTFTYLPSQAFKAFSAAIMKAAEAKGLQRTPGPDPQYNDVCWKGGPVSPNALVGVFPGVDLVFQGGAVLPLRPLQYLFVLGGGSYCLGVFDNQGQGTLLGGITVRNVLVQYDRRNQRAGFLPLNSCSEVAGLIQPVTRKDGPSPSPSPAPSPRPDGSPAPSGGNAGARNDGSNTTTSGAHAGGKAVDSAGAQGNQPDGSGGGGGGGGGGGKGSGDGKDPSSDVRQAGNGKQAGAGPPSGTAGSPAGDRGGGPGVQEDKGGGPGGSAGSALHTPGTAQGSGRGTTSAKGHVDEYVPRPPHPGSAGWAWAAWVASGPLLVLSGFLVVGGLACAWTYRQQILRAVAAWQRAQRAGSDDEDDPLLSQPPGLSDLLKPTPSTQGALLLLTEPPSSKGALTPPKA